jgi:large subunit ribosomal protein L6
MENKSKNMAGNNNAANAARQLKTIEETVEIPQGVTVSLDNSVLAVRGPKGETRRPSLDPKVKVRVEGNEVRFTASPATKKEKTRIGSAMAHLKNMISGVQEGVTYRLRICSGHFPMNVSVSGSQFIVKNFLGEKIPRTLKLGPDVKIRVEGDIIVVEGIDKERVSQAAASIETLTRRVGFDRRIFQDGIYITEKNGRKME